MNSSSSPLFSSTNGLANWKIVDLVGQNQSLKDITIQVWNELNHQSK
jgi:hypothetical protein